jgi:hypothetical protein
MWVTTSDIVESFKLTATTEDIVVSEAHVTTKARVT